MYKMYSFHGFARNVETVRFIPFLPVANPEIPLHIGKATLYDNTSPTWEIFSLEISVKIMNVMCCLNLLLLKLRNYSKWEIKIAELV